VMENLISIRPDVARIRANQRLKLNVVRRMSRLFAAQTNFWLHTQAPLAHQA
jgi:hypothetical protein